MFWLSSHYKLTLNEDSKPDTFKEDAKDETLNEDIGSEISSEEVKMDNSPNTAATPDGVTAGTLPNTTSLVMDTTDQQVMPQGFIGYQHPAGYPLGPMGYSALHIGGQMHPGIPLSAVYYQNPSLAYTASLGNIATQPTSSGLVPGQLPLTVPVPPHSVYNQPILSHQSTLDGPPFHWASQPNLSQSVLPPGTPQMPPGIVDYQHLLSQGAVVKVATIQPQILPMPSTATKQTATTQTTTEMVSEETFTKETHEMENGAYSTGENTPIRAESPAPASKESPIPASPDVSYHPQQILNSILLATKPKKLNPSLQLRSPGSPNSPEGRPFQSRTSFDGSSPSSRRSLTNSTTSPTSIGSPGVNSDHLNTVVPCYERPVKRDQCLRCYKKVYPLEQLGPIKEVMYHKTCFTCVACGTQLNLKNFGHNPNDLEDLNVFCIAHRPKERSVSVDATSVNIARALNAPKLDKVNEQIRGDRYPSEVLARSSYGQAAASAFITPQEAIYYGMGFDDHSRQQHQYSQETETGYLLTHQPPQQPPNTHAEWIDGRYTIVNDSDDVHPSKERHERQVSNDEVFAYPSSGNLNGRHSPESPESSESPSLSVPMRPSMDTVLSEMTSKMMIFKDDSRESRPGPLMRSDRPSTSSSSPTRVVRTDFKDIHSAKSSMGSNISRHGSLDLHSSYPAQGWNRASLTSLERSDRPSMTSLSLNHGGGGGRDRTELAMPGQSEVVSVSIHVDPSRYLPTNETKRMDRPSQYS